MVPMKYLFRFLCVFIFSFQLFGIFPRFHGPRSLSLGYASVGFGSDLNIVSINPALSASMQMVISGIQYQNSYFDTKGFEEQLRGVLQYDLNNYHLLDPADQQTVLSQLEEIYGNANSIYGFQSSMAGVVARNYGISYSKMKMTLMNTGETELFSQTAEPFSPDGISSLLFDFISLDVNRITLGYSFNLTQTIAFGIGVHYLKGNLTRFQSPIGDEIFSPDTSARQYMEYGWDRADESFSKIVTDIGISMNMGAYVTCGVTIRNLGSPTIHAAETELTLNQRYIAGVMLRPGPQWGIYIDSDLKKTQLLYNDKEMMPFSMGVEKSFFNGIFYMRAGFLNDLAERYFFGKKSSILYCFGSGITMKRTMIDIGISINNEGIVNNFAVSGYIRVK